MNAISDVPYSRAIPLLKDTRQAKSNLNLALHTHQKYTQNAISLHASLYQYIDQLRTASHARSVIAALEHAKELQQVEEKVDDL